MKLKSKGIILFSMALLLMLSVSMLTASAVYIMGGKKCEDGVCIKVTETNSLGVFLHNAFQVFAVSPDPAQPGETVTWSEAMSLDCSDAAPFYDDFSVVSCQFTEPDGSFHFVSETSCCYCSVVAECSYELLTNADTGIWSIDWEVCSEGMCTFHLLDSGHETFEVAVGELTTTVDEAPCLLTCPDTCYLAPDGIWYILEDGSPNILCTNCVYPTMIPCESDEKCDKGICIPKAATTAPPLPTTTIPTCRPTPPSEKDSVCEEYGFVIKCDKDDNPYADFDECIDEACTQDCDDKNRCTRDVCINNECFHYPAGCTHDMLCYSYAKLSGESSSEFKIRCEDSIGTIYVNTEIPYCTERNGKCYKCLPDGTELTAEEWGTGNVYCCSGYMERRDYVDKACTGKAGLLHIPSEILCTFTGEAVIGEGTKYLCKAKEGEKILTTAEEHERECNTYTTYETCAVVPANYKCMWCWNKCTYEPTGKCTGKTPYEKEQEEISGLFKGLEIFGKELCIPRIGCFSYLMIGIILIVGVIILSFLRK